MARELKNESDCRLIYAEIVNGYSCDASGKFFIRHFSELDTAETEFKRKVFLEEALRDKLPSEKEKLELLIKWNHWSQEEEDGYQGDLADIRSIEASIAKLVVPQQIEAMKKALVTRREESKKKWASRGFLLGMTREEYANRRAIEHHILSAFYKDGSLRERLFSQDDLDNISNLRVEFFMNIYQNVHEVFTEKNLKKIAVCPFFLNAYMVSSDNAFFFFGKPVAHLTIYQLSLFGRGSYYKMILEENSARPPEDYYDDLIKVIQFYDKQYSIMLGKRNARS